MSEILVTREITKFSKQTELLEREFDITHIPFSILEEVFADALAQDPKLYYVHELTPEKIGAFQPYVPELFDFENFDYFLEASQVNAEQRSLIIPTELSA